MDFCGLPVGSAGELLRVDMFAAQLFGLLLLLLRLDGGLVQCRLGIGEGVGSRGEMALGPHEVRRCSSASHMCRGQTGSGCVLAGCIGFIFQRLARRLSGHLASSTRSSARVLPENRSVFEELSLCFGCRELQRDLCL